MLATLATMDDSPELRGAAVSLLGHRGTSRAFEPLIRLLGVEEDATVRSDAVDALGTLTRRYPRLEADTEPILFRIMAEERDPFVRERALFFLSLHQELAPETLAHLSLLASGNNRLMNTRALWALARHGSDVDSLVANALGAQRERRSPLLSESFMYLSHQLAPQLLEIATTGQGYEAACAHAALGRMDRGVGRVSDHHFDAYRLETNGHKMNRDATAQLEQADWMGSGIDEIMAAARDSRLVVFGEIHLGEGPMRDHQMELLRAFVKDVQHDALGYEPSVMASQQMLIDLAQEMGVKTLALETNWESLRGLRRSMGRDIEAAAAINDYLNADPANRMFVLRGEDHVVPHGFMDSLLEVRPMIVLSLQQLPFGSTDFPEEVRQFRIRRMGPIKEGDSVFLWPIEVLEGDRFDRLADWIEARQGLLRSAGI